MMEILETLLISALPALIAGIVSYIVSNNKAKSDINTVKEQNENDLNKLLTQHNNDLESLIATHKLDIEKKDLDYQYQSKILENTAKYQATNNITAELLPQLLAMMLANPEVKGELEKKMAESLHKN
ncbi:MAG TPA: hypothetical protein O0X69_04135 [Methanocorpusculum sp.]|nr:hypothetical protein [Methanocorpusculum sp.]